MHSNDDDFAKGIIWATKINHINALRLIKNNFLNPSLNCNGKGYVCAYYAQLYASSGLAIATTYGGTKNIIVTPANYM